MTVFCAGLLSFSDFDQSIALFVRAILDVVGSLTPPAVVVPLSRIHMEQMMMTGSTACSVGRSALGGRTPWQPCISRNRIAPQGEKQLRLRTTVFNISRMRRQRSSCRRLRSRLSSSSRDLCSLLAFSKAR